MSKTNFLCKGLADDICLALSHNDYLQLSLAEHANISYFTSSEWDSAGQLADHTFFKKKVERDSLSLGCKCKVQVNEECMKLVKIVIRKINDHTEKNLLGVGH